MKKPGDPEIKQLSESLIDEMVTAIGLPKKRLYHNLFLLLFSGITTRFAHVGLPFDKTLAIKGLPAACQGTLDLFCNPAQVSGTEFIPAEGPLLIASNHAGAYDALLIMRHVNRPDTHWISSEIPFLDLLPNIRQHIFFAPRKDALDRALALGNAIKHLRNGGALLYFASGHRDPDPAVFPGAEDAMDGWLDVYETFFKYVPGLQLIHSLVSGVVSSHWAHHPLTWFRRKQIDKHRLAEFGQVISQLLKPGKLLVTPSISFNQPASEDELRKESANGFLREAVIAHGKALLHSHIQEFGGML